ncbi:hypothetical protein [Paenibacillus elgii]|uniref:hypothetical protein n=1 Tax=Paenibacillus elgii TaxID=189691 RepID=UPI0013D065C8|nr:hypothetical protein [Paenibacillus elgii]
MLKKSRVICILGMHRSGTSVLTRAINLLGVDIGPSEQIIQPLAGNNPEGFWEHLGVVEIHEKILQFFSSYWDTASPLPERWWQSKDIEPYKADLKKIISEQFLDKEIWSWKDPRTCLMLPLWQEILNELQLEINYVISLRNPLDVANSLVRRDNFSIDKSLGIWTLYTLSALYWTIDAKRTIIQFDDLLENWELTLREISDVLDIKWPVGEAEIELKENMNSFIKPRLRHSQSSLDDLLASNIPKPAKDVFKLAIEACFNKALLYSLDFNKQILELYADYAEYSRLINNKKAIIANGSKIIEVFWSDSNIFSQEDSTYSKIVADNAFHEYIFNIPSNKSCLRIDPTNFPSVVIIKSVELLQEQENNVLGRKQILLWSSENCYEGILLDKQVQWLNSDNNLYLLANEGDPSLIINIPNIESEMVLRIIMRIETTLTKETIQLLQLKNEQNLKKLQQNLNDINKQFNEINKEVARLEIIKKEYEKYKITAEENMANKSHMLEKQESEIMILKERVTSLNEKINIKKLKIINLNQRLTEHQNHYIRLEQKYQFLDDDYSRVLANLQNANEELEKIKKSRSWRYTAPLRKLKN